MEQSALYQKKTLREMGFGIGSGRLGCVLMNTPGDGFVAGSVGEAASRTLGVCPLGMRGRVTLGTCKIERRDGMDGCWS